MNADRMNGETAERLLGGLPVDESIGTRPVVLLLTAVRAAARPGELAGLGHAVQGFRHVQAQRHRSPPTQRAAPVERDATAADLRTGTGPWEG
ncbi:hypothetical protein ACQPZK_10000 [Micromonospora sp. CA-249363]|jgi:hypothetical protein|uniref:hypothetical protein n=1 Tax=Micromonospora sp. CA-249363 TaxID=3239963 RepID=UPI003D91C7CD